MKEHNKIITIAIISLMILIIIASILMQPGPSITMHKKYTVTHEPIKESCEEKYFIVPDKYQIKAWEMYEIARDSHANKYKFWKLIYNVVPEVNEKGIFEVYTRSSYMYIKKVCE